MFSPDAHWHPGNMIYGNHPLKINERKGSSNDPLGLNTYTYVPEIIAITQSSNLYAYAMNNPLAYQDPSGDFIISTTALLMAGSAAILGTLGGFTGNYIANQKGVTGWEKAGYIAGGTLIGGTIGLTGGYFAGPVVTTATGISGISVTGTGIATISTSPWVLDQFTRGRVIEQMLGGMGNNFPVIDSYMLGANNVASSISSIKSLNLAAQTYQTGNSVYNLVMR
jgi:hypothetical protein